MSFFERLETLNGWQAFWRPAIAYGLASYVAATTPLLLLRQVPDDGLITWAIWIAQALYFGVVPGILVALIAFLPTVLMAVLLHETRLRRGFTEAAIGGLMGPPVLLFAVIGTQLMHAGPDTSSLSPFVGAGFGGLIMVGVMAGALAGFAYWLAVGRPENPNVRS